MKDKKKWLLLGLIGFFVLLVIVGGIILAVVLLKDDGDEESGDTPTVTVEEDEPVAPEYDERGSAEAIAATYEVAKTWATDVKLSDCTGMAYSSVSINDVTFENLGEDEGKFASWICTYYSASKNAISTIDYKEGAVGENDPMDLGEYGYLTYGDAEYVSDPTQIVDSTAIYSKVIENGLDLESNTYAMYLTDTMDYGFVWKVFERSKTEMDEYEIGLVKNTYIFKPLTGDLVEVVAEEVL